uniref:keratin-associated protein 5-9-like n=1 Tax=Jaculus jaculus TaxID=51337 RepID=UPI001E1B1B21|nr:keratin-associated protein 5-9-like [Jaculus jaculus]XP_045009410.1 keratin-associated protein 5-9-like [Jaculus jaculus]
MDFSLGLRLGPRNKKTTQQEPPTSSGHGPSATSPCLSCPSACACPCPGSLPPACSCTACPSYAATCQSCPGLPGPPCTCSCPPCPACPPLTCPHTSYGPCSGPPLACCHLSPCPGYSLSKGQAACLSSHCLGCSENCSCSRRAAWAPQGSTGCCNFCFRGHRTSRGLCLII